MKDRKMLSNIDDVIYSLRNISLTMNSYYFDISNDDS